MQEFVKKLIERLEEEKLRYFLTIANTGDEKLDAVYEGIGNAIDKVIRIVKRLSEEYGKDTNVTTNGWIPTAEMLFPRYGQKVFASVKCEDCKHEIIITKYERQEYWHNGIITAWQPLPAPYQPKGE